MDASRKKIGVGEEVKLTVIYASIGKLVCHWWRHSKSSNRFDPSSGAVTNQDGSLESFLADIQIPQNPPEDYSIEEWKSLSDMQKKILIYARTRGPSPEWLKFSEEERSASLAKSAEDVKRHPVKKISNEEYWEHRTGGEATKHQLSLLLIEIEKLSTRRHALNKKYPHGGAEFEKEKAELEKQRQAIIKEFGQTGMPQGGQSN